MNSKPWQIIDSHTGLALQRKYESFGKANRRAEQLNQAFGAVRFGAAFKDESPEPEQPHFLVLEKRTNHENF